MNNILAGKNTHISYENFAAECPYCGMENVYNRASDLGTFDLISRQKVSCENKQCGKEFYIKGDFINNNYEMLLFDCYKLIENKHYMNTILNVAQAYEMFFALFFRAELIYKPFQTIDNIKIEDINILEDSLFKATEKCAFEKMRALFLNYLVLGTQPTSKLEINNFIKSIHKNLVKPSKKSISAISDKSLSAYLEKISSTDINSLRNKIVHKKGYRPTLNETNKYLSEARDILINLTHYFNIMDSINSYSPNAPRDT